ncbi:hypothetical protein K353_06624 [Kitasatospora sp. SolWspMP-SS2h]|uniref:hypothetical protein n=1 Tax=Kitasatospora sp. SolWspMP-SS2h TaxID=1305729 RepID=UPI000DBABF51|nr:hypothetical protein [Kitasatospora sp. SolWspMP-SS2h]RAJ29642.1 hypothetical protein K353_06624 [Kitasatospora sp. SolWspMP-SS2h]
MSSDTTPPQPDAPAAPATPPPPDPWAPPAPDPFRPPSGAADPARARTGSDRRRGWQLGAAVLLTLVTGAATAVLVTLPDRTDVPGLATPNDGRYAFPELTLPPLPAGASAPSDYKVRTHAADLRGLLLPLPEGAVATGPSADPSAGPSSSAAPGTSATASASPSAAATASGAPSATPSGSASGSAGPALPAVAGRWIPCDRDAMLAGDDAHTLRLTTDACRGAAAQGWTTPDGTRTELRLFHFGTGDEAADYFAGATLMTGTKDIASWHLDAGEKYPIAFGQVDVRLSDEQAHGMPTGRVGWVQSGDVVAMVQLTNPQGVPVQAFRQVVALQSSMLS